MARDNRPSAFQIILIVITVVAFVLQVIGLATNGWIVMHYSSIGRTFSHRLDISMGLWRVSYCINEICGTKNIDDFWREYTGSTGYTNLIESKLDEYRTESIIGAVTIFIALICILIETCYKGSRGNKADRIGMWITICICAGVSALTAALAAGQFGRNVLDSHRTLGYLSPYLVSYSVILTGVGAILAAFTFFVAAVTCYRVSNHRNSCQQQQGQQYHINAINQQQPAVIVTNPSAGSQY